MENEEKKKVPTIEIKLLDAERFLVEVNLDCPSPALVRAMLYDAMKTIDAMIADQEAVTFEKKMAAASTAYAAMQKNPRRM